MYLLTFPQAVKQRVFSLDARLPDNGTQGPGTRGASSMKVLAAPRAMQPSQLGKIQGIRRKAPTSSVTSSSLPTMVVRAQPGAGSEASARAARQARRDQMREAASSELYSRGRVSEQSCQQQLQQSQATDASASAQDAEIPPTGSAARTGVAPRAQATRTAQALAEKPQQPAAQQDEQTHPQGASREHSAGSPEPRVTRSSARAAQAQGRHHPYRKPSPAAASVAAKGGPAVQTRSAVRRQQCDEQDAETHVSDKSGPVTRRQHMFCAAEQLRSAQAPETEPPAPEPTSDAAPSRMKLRACRPAGRQAGVDMSNGAARPTYVKNLAESSPLTAAQPAKPAPSRRQRCKRPRDKADIAPLAAEQPAKPGDDGREVRQPLDSAQHSGMQPDVAPEASHPPKRSRRAAPKSTAGLAASVPAETTSQTVRQARKIHSSSKQTRRVQRQCSAVQQAEMAARQEPQSAQQLPYIIPQGHSTPQHDSPSAQHTAQRDQAQDARTNLSERSGPVTRSRSGRLSGRDQERSAQASQTEAHAPAHTAAQQRMQLRAHKPTERQAGDDGTSGAARRTAQSRSPVQPELSRPTPPTPAQPAESAPSRAQRGKRLREIAEIAILDAEHPATGSCGGGKGQCPDSAEHNSVQPDLAIEAAHPTKRSRLAPSNSNAGPEAAAPAACSASATSRSLSGAQRRRKVSKQRLLFQAHGSFPQHVPSFPQQTAVAAALQETPAAPQEPMLPQQAPAAALEELHAPQAPHITLQGPGAAQEMPAPAQPAAQPEQVEAVAAPAGAVPTATGAARPRQQRPQPPSWRPKPDSFLHKEIVRQFPCAIMGADDDWDSLMLLSLPLPPAWAQRIVRERSMTRGFIDSGGQNINLFGRRWEKPPCSSLSVASGPTSAVA